MTEDSRVAAGGWCAPSDAIYHPGVHPIADAFPSLAVSRGGYQFPKPGTPEWDAAQERRRADEALGAMIYRAIGEVVTAQDYAIATALHDAIPDDLIVEVYPAPYRADTWRGGWGPYRFIGIALRERVRPTEPYGVHWLPARDATWDDDDD